MTRSATSTDRLQPEVDSGFRPWHFYILLAMAGATAAVMLARDTHPVALLLLSAAVVAAGLVGLALHAALSGFFGLTDTNQLPLPASDREVLEREKLLTLRSIKELEFDRAMGKVSDVDFSEMSARLRARALLLMEQLEQQPVSAPSARPAAVAPAHRLDHGACVSCGTANDEDARFCKRCGARLDREGDG